MEIMQVEVENIKCGGCSNSIVEKILEIEGVTSVKIDVEASIVSVEGDADQEAVTKKLHDIGYPEVGTTSGFDSVTSKIRSYVSCVIGKTK
jgi:copper chaperone